MVKKTPQKDTNLLGRQVAVLVTDRRGDDGRTPNAAKRFNLGQVRGERVTTLQLDDGSLLTKIEHLIVFRSDEVDDRWLDLEELEKKKIIRWVNEGTGEDNLNWSPIAVKHRDCKIVRKSELSNIQDQQEKSEELVLQDEKEARKINLTQCKEEERSSFETLVASNTLLPSKALATETGVRSPQEDQESNDPTKGKRQADSASDSITTTKRPKLVSNNALPTQIWVTIGITQHPALLLENKEDGTKLIKWDINGKNEWIDANVRVSSELGGRGSRSSRPPKNYRPSPPTIVGDAGSQGIVRNGNSKSSKTMDDSLRPGAAEAVAEVVAERKAPKPSHHSGESENSIADSHDKVRAHPTQLASSQSSGKRDPGSNTFIQEQVATGDKKRSSEDDWLDQMENWLLNVPHGPRNETATVQNTKDIMKGVRNLANGKGLAMKNWEHGKGEPVYYYGGTKVDLSFNFAEMLDEANNLQRFLGKDTTKGKVWRAPLKRLQLFKEWFNGK